jgi:hypothetical protein
VTPFQLPVEPKGLRILKVKTKIEAELTKVETLQLTDAHQEREAEGEKLPSNAKLPANTFSTSQAMLAWGSQPTNAGPTAPARPTPA